MTGSLSHEFGTIRSFFWPIYRHEIRKVLPMLFMMCLICFNYSILRGIKDSVVVTASGAEALPFIKVWAVLPSAILLTYLITQLSNRFSQERVFYIIMSGFLFFYAVFAFILYPYSEAMHPNAFADQLEARLPIGFQGLVAMFRYWTFTLFYVLAELWSNGVLFVLFWGFANEITKVDEAKRFYPVFMIGSNIAASVAGQVGNIFTVGDTYNPLIPFGSNAWEQTLMIAILIIIVFGLITMAIFRWMNKNVLNDPQFDALHSSRWDVKQKKKMSVRESFSFLSSSRYLVCIGILVIDYNLAINLVEVIWKNQVRELYSSPSDYYYFMNNITTAFGLISTVAAFFLPRMMNSFGWTSVALITPVIMLVTGLGFFGLMLFQENLSAVVMTLFGTTPLMLVVMFGSAQYCLSKAAKYSVFDATKEISFIPLPHEVKLKGKAAIDGIGSRIGKSGSSLAHQGLMMFFGGLASSVPYVAALLMGVIVLWISAVNALGKKFQALVGGEKAGGDKVVDERPVRIPPANPTAEPVVYRT